MDITKRTFVDELVAGARLSSLFVLRDKELRLSSRSGPYALYSLADLSGRIRAIQFDVDAAALPPEGSVVIASGLVEGRGRTRRFKVSSLRPADSWDPADFIARVLRPDEEMQAEFHAYVRSIGDGALRATISTVFATGSCWKRFCLAPLATTGFGARLGAALEHSLRLARGVEALAENHPTLDRDLLLTAALLRFTGCVDAFMLAAQIEATDSGAELGVTMLSLHRLHEATVRSRLHTARAVRLERVVSADALAATTDSLLPDGQRPLPEARLLRLCLETENAAASFEEHGRYRRLATSDPLSFAA
jgi:3'-5' exoribonuclease